MVMARLVAGCVVLLALASAALYGQGNRITITQNGMDARVSDSGNLKIECALGCSAGEPASNYALEAGGNLASILDRLPAALASHGGLKVEGIAGGIALPISGTFWQATQPVSGTIAVSNFPASQPVTGTFWQATQPVSGTFWQATQPVSGTFWQDTQPVSGTVTANAGTNLNTSALALEAGNLATLVAKDFATQTTLALIKAKTDNLDVLLSTRTKPADAQHAIVDSGSVTANAGTNLNTSLLALEAGGNLAALVAKDYATQTTLALIKAKTDNLDALLSTRTKPADQQHTIIDSGTTVVTQPTGTNLHAVVDSGSITANAGTNLNTSALATAAGLTDRTQKTQITDGTRDGTVKAASTLPALTDTAVVTTQRDPLPAGTNIIGSLSANQSDNVAQFGGTNVSTGAGAGGAGIPRVTVSNDSSILGTKTNNNAAPGATNFGALGAIANAAAATVAEGNLVLQSTDLVQQTRVTLNPTVKSTFWASANAWTIPASPTDMFSITGSASKTVKVLRLIFTVTQTTAAAQTFFLIKRSAADTTGTSVATTIVPADSSTGSATAVSKHWTANPGALGSAVGNVDTLRVQVPVPLNADARFPMTFDFTQGGLAQGIVLRGTAQELHLNFAGATLPTGMSITGTWVWTEE